jgi:hypothetical protein
LAPGGFVTGGLLPGGLVVEGLAPAGVVPDLVPPGPAGLTRFLRFGC